MNNPLHILQTFDRHLTAPAEMTLFGRAALALGYGTCHAVFAATQDADAILPLAWLAAEDENPEIQALFSAAQPIVLALTEAQGHTRAST